MVFMHVFLSARRDACSDLLQETGEEPYVTCFNYLSRMGPENPGAEPEAVESYCSAKCDETLNTFFDQIDVVCNPGGGGVRKLYSYPN